MARDFSKITHTHFNVSFTFTILLMVTAAHCKLLDSSLWFKNADCAVLYISFSLSFFSTKMSNFWGLPTIYTLLDSLLTNFLWTSCCENMGLMAHSHRHLFEILQGSTCFLTKKTSRGSKTQFHTYVRFWIKLLKLIFIWLGYYYRETI